MTEDCKPCRLNIGAAMLVATCKEIKERDGDAFDIDCKLLETELIEKEDKVAEQIIQEIYNKVMEKGSDEDKDVVQEIYELSHEKTEATDNTSE